MCNLTTSAEISECLANLWAQFIYKAAFLIPSVTFELSLIVDIVKLDFRIVGFWEIWILGKWNFGKVGFGESGIWGKWDFR